MSHQSCKVGCTVFTDLVTYTYSITGFAMLLQSLPALSAYYIATGSA